jgi:arylsulfatase A-like enzyme
MSASAGLWVSLELAATNFFLVTGSSLDLALIEYALQPETDLWALVRGSTPTGFFVAGGLGALWLLVAPWAARRLLARPAAAPAPPWPRSRWLLAASLLLLSLLPPFAEPSAPFAANAVLHIARSGLDRLGEEQVAERTFSTLGLSLLPAAGKPKNIVVIVLESTRAAATTLHNPSLATTPYLVELSKQSLWADRAYAVVPHTSKALVSVLCGVEPNLTLPITEATSRGLPAKCMAKLLAEQGYRTAFYQTATSGFENRPQLVKNMGYQEFKGGEDLPINGFEKSNYFGVEDNAMLLPTKAWIEADKSTPFFLTYLTVTPHHEYLAPRRYGRHKFAESDPLNRYLNSVHYVDHFVKNVVEQLKALGVWEETILVVVGDHGEGFGEHKLKQHDSILYEEGLRVPLLIHDPSDPRERRVPGLTSQLDVLPTALARAGWSLNGAPRGQDMREIKPDRRHYAYCWHERSCIATLQGTTKIIHNFGKKPDEAFNLAEDPEERANLADRTPELSTTVAAMMRWRRGVNASYINYYKDRLDGIVFDAPPQISHPLRFEIGDYMEFLGYDVDTVGPIMPRAEVTMVFYYKVKRRIPSGWRFSTQGAASGDRWVNMDHLPAEGLLPMSEWRPGTYIKDVHKVRMPGYLKPGEEVRVVQGLYLARKGQATEHALIRGAEADDKQKVSLFTLKMAGEQAKPAVKPAIKAPTKPLVAPGRGAQ